MSVRSMTGFGNTAQGLAAEVRSVNRRNLDVRLRLPDGWGLVADNATAQSASAQGQRDTSYHGMSRRSKRSLWLTSTGRCSAGIESLPMGRDEDASELGAVRSGAHRRCRTRDRRVDCVGSRVAQRVERAAGA